MSFAPWTFLQLFVSSPARVLWTAFCYQEFSVYSHRSFPGPCPLNHANTQKHWHAALRFCHDLIQHPFVQSSNVTAAMKANFLSKSFGRQDFPLAVSSR